MKPDIISTDAGSTDSGPYCLGKGIGKVCRESLKSDMHLMMRAAKQLSIPITIGSCGTAATMLLYFFLPEFRLAVAASGGLYFGLAGCTHLFNMRKGEKELFAMISDFFIFAVLAVLIFVNRICV